MSHATATSDASAAVGAPVETLDTPALLVDLERLDRNLRSWQAAATAGGARFRPHVKTHKIPAIARMQAELGACGIAAAKVSEAEPFAEAGLHDVVIAYPVVGTRKWERIAALAAGGTRIAVNVDSEAGARGLSAAAAAAGARVGVQLEIDSGFHRVGWMPTELDTIVGLARLAESLPGLDFEGLTTHRGVFFEGAEGRSADDCGREEGQILVDLAGVLREHGVECRELTAGGTMTGRGVAQVAGVTEVRAGTYVFYDLMQLGFGSCTPDELALSVLCTVVSDHGDRVTIDGGSKTFSGDRGVIGGASVAAKGVAKAVDREAWVERLTEEHGMITLGADLLDVGEKVAFYPTHACTCINLSDVVHGVRDGVVEVVWSVDARGQRA